MKYSIIFILFCVSHISFAKDLILSQTNIGALKLSQSSLVSFLDVKSAFPNYIVTHSIGSGDSADFHRIEIKDNEEQLFYIESYFDEKTNKATLRFDIDLLVITSSKVIDRYGISVGDDVNKVIKQRGSNLVVSANHFDNSIGNEQIYYQVQIPLSEEMKNKGLDYISPEGVTKEKIILENPIVTTISWPYPSW